MADIDLHFQFEMGEAVTHESGLLAPRTREWRFDQRRLAVRKIAAPCAQRRLQHGAQQSVFRPAHQIDGAVPVQGHESCAALQRARTFRAPYRKSLRDAQTPSLTMRRDWAFST